MRILSLGNMYPPHHLGGYELVWQGAVEHMRARGHDVSVLTTDLSFGERGADPGHVHRDLRWYWRDHRWPRMSIRARYALERHNAEVLEQRIAQDEPDVVELWAMGGMSLSLLTLLSRAGLPAVAYVSDDWLTYAREVDGWTRLMRRSGAARVAARIIGMPVAVDAACVRCWAFVSEFTRARARAGDWQLAQTRVLSTGIDDRYLSSPPPSRPWTGRLLYVGRIDERKGIATAITALASLPDSCTLTIVGGGDDAAEQTTRALAETLGVAGRVTWTGPAAELSDVIAHYDGHDAVLFPAIWDEPWGLVPLEAMARGRPVVATGTGGSAEYLRDGENCLLVGPDDAPATARAVQRLIDDEALRERLRAAGLTVASEHTQSRFNAGVEELTLRVADQTSPAGPE